MQLLLRIFLFICLSISFGSMAKADTYFLKIGQVDENEREIKSYLQTCSPETSPCTFMMPVLLDKGGSKNIAVVMRFKDAPFITLQFYWDQMLLGTHNGGEDYYRLPAGDSNVKIDPRLVMIYTPLSSTQKPTRGDAVLKFSEQLIATFKVQATVTKE